MAGIDLNTKLILHADGQNGGKEIIDSGNTGHIVTQVGTAKLDNTNPNNGSTNLLLDGNSDLLSINDSPDFDMWGSTTQDYTIDLLVYFNNVTSQNGLFSQVVDANNYIEARVVGGLIQIAISDGVTFDFVNTAAGTVNNNQWYHISFCRKGGALSAEWGIYVDGVQKAYLSTTVERIFNAPFHIGAWIMPGYYLDGWIDEFRMNNNNDFSANPNIGLTDTINIPAVPHSSTINTKLLLDMNSHDVSGDGGSNNFHIPTFVGTTQTDTSTKVFGDSSFLFDGNSDYITFPASTEFDIFANNTDSPTLDFRIKFNVFGSVLFYEDTFDGDNAIRLLNTINGALQIFIRIGGTDFLNYNTADNVLPNDANFHHVTFIIVGTGSSKNIGIYVDGIQVGFTTLSTNHVTSATTFFIGTNALAPGLSNNLDGWLDEYRIQNSNVFNANPNVGLTDTITVPLEAYSPPPPLATAPTSLVATKIDHTQIDLSWVTPASDGGSPIIGYQIERERLEGPFFTPTGFAVLVADTGSTSITFSDFVGAITHYNYRVSAITINGAGPSSNLANAQTDRYIWAETRYYCPYTVNGSDFTDISPNGTTFTGINGIPSTSNSTWTLGKGTGSHGILRLDNTAFNTSVIRADDASGIDIFGNADEEWTIHIYFKPSLAVTAFNQNFLFGINNTVNGPGPTEENWHLTMNKANTAIEFVRNSPGSVQVKLSSPNGSVLDLSEHRVTIVKLKNGIGALYLDDIQVDYTTQFSQVPLTVSNFQVGGVSGASKTGFYGFLDEFQLLKGNVYGSQPNVGLTDIITTENEIVPTKPLGLNIASSTQTEASLQWTTPDFDGGSPVTGYRIERESPLGGGFSVLVSDTGNTNTTFIDSTLVIDTQYNYRIYALSAIGRSGQSNEISLTTTLSEDGIRYSRFKATHEHVDPTKDWTLDKFSGIHCKNYDKL